MTIDHPTPLDTDAVPCRANPERMFPTGAGAVRMGQDERAKAVCDAGDSGRPCPVKDRCLAYALEFAVEGIWGASTYAERQKFRDDNGIVPVSITPGTARATVYRRAS